MTTPLGTRRIVWLSLIVASFVPGRLPAQRSAAGAGFATLDSLHAPAALAKPITVRLTDVRIRAAVGEIANGADATIVFAPDLVGLDRRITFRADAVPAATLLVRLLDGSGIQAMVSPTGSVVLVAQPHDEAAHPLIAGAVTQPGGPLQGVRLFLAGTRFESVSDLSGRFIFGRVPPGDYTVRGLRLGFAPIAQPLHVASGGVALRLELSMTPAAVPVDAVIVTPGYFGVMQPGMASAQALSRQQIETVPQLGEDVYRAVGRLPGVAATDFSAKFSLRGEPGDALAVTLDGLPLVEPFHLKDLGDALSIIDLASLGGAELITGGPSAEYGDQLSGVFRLHSIEPRSDRARASVGLSLTNLRGMTEGGFAGGKGSWLASGRRGYLDLAFKLASISDSLYPRYDDLFAKVTYELPWGGELAAHALHAGDNLRYLNAGDPALESAYTSDYFWTTLDGHVGSRLRQQSVAWIGSLNWLRTGNQFDGTVPIIRMSDARNLRTVGLRQEWSVDLGSRALLKFGGELGHEHASYDYSRLLRLEPVENHAIVVRTDTTLVALSPASDRAGFYVSQRVRPVDAFTAELGARYDHISNTGDAVWSPRANAAWQVAPTTTVRGSWGDYVQPQSVFSLQVEDGVRAFAPAEHAIQKVIGVEQGLWNGLAARAEAYDRDLTHIRPRYVNLKANTHPVPEIAYDRVLLAPTGGRSRGVELSVERQGGTRIDWSANYAISSSTEQVAGVRIPRSSDQPYALHAEWSFHPVSNKWRLSLSELWHTGFPYTPDSFRVDTLTSAPGTLSARVTREAGQLYSQRLPAYQRVDARWTRFIDTRSGRVTVFVEVFNLFNTKNLRDRYTDVGINNQLNVTYYQGTREQLPRIPSFGISWEF